MGNVAKYNTDKMKIALQTKLHAISVIKQDIGPECATVANLLMRSQDRQTSPIF